MKRVHAGRTYFSTGHVALVVAVRRVGNVVAVRDWESGRLFDRPAAVGELRPVREFLPHVLALPSDPETFRTLADPARVRYVRATAPTGVAFLDRSQVAAVYPEDVLVVAAGEVFAVDGRCSPVTDPRTGRTWFVPAAAPDEVFSLMGWEWTAGKPACALCEI
jgi:hypothetical protein